MRRLRSAIVASAVLAAVWLTGVGFAAPEETGVPRGSGVSIVANSLYVKPDFIADNEARLTVIATLENTTRKRKDLGLRSTLYDTFGRVVAQGSTRMVMRPSRRKKAGQAVVLEKPRLWSPDDPSLYTLVTEVVEGEKVISRQQTTLGLRTTDANGGLSVNGRQVALKGLRVNAREIGSNENGRRLMRLLSKAGGNMLVIDRMLPSDIQLLDYADREGIMVVDTAMNIRRSTSANLNHPSVVMWNNPQSAANDAADSIKVVRIAETVTERAAIMDEAGFPTDDFYRLQAEWGGDRSFGAQYKEAGKGVEPAALRVTAEQQEISSSDFRPGYVAVEIVDRHGRVCRDATNRIDYSVNRRTGSVTPHNGRALIPVSGNGVKETIKITARSAGLKDGKATVRAL